MTKKFKVTHSEDIGDYLHFTIEGEAEIEHIENLYDAILMHAKQRKNFNVLVDATNAEYVYPLEKFVPMVNRLAEKLKHLRIARLCQVDDFRQDLIEAMSIKQNINLRNFPDQMQALRWLLKE